MAKSKFEFSLSRDSEKKGIWQYSRYFVPVDERFQLSLGEGNTPVFYFSDSLILKREDLNPTGSLKDRGMAYLLSKALEEGKENLVLSSSGNAAVSASAFCDMTNFNLTVFTSFSINRKKLERIKGARVNVVQSLRPISDATKLAREKNFFNLRPSRQNFGMEGYQTIAFEIAEQVGIIDNIFLPVSSGVSLIGIAKGFRKLGFLPRFHVCQSSAVCPIASVFDKDFMREKRSIAEALVARYTPLRQSIIELVNESKGSGWVIENIKIIEAQKTLQSKGISTSNEGALALAAVFKAEETGWNLDKTVCLLTGKKY